MKFTDGYWLPRPGVSVLRPQDVDEVVDGGDHLVVHAPTAPIAARGDTLNRPLVTVRLDSPPPGVVGVRVQHHAGARERGPRFRLERTQGHVTTRVPEALGEEPAVLTAGDLEVHVRTDGP
jgi:alpha-D-xyloside xylohydrolase